MRRIIYAISYLVAAVAGIGLLIFNHQAVEESRPVLQWIVIVFGIFFIVPGLYMIFSSLRYPRNQSQRESIPWMPVTIGVITLVWGVLMLCMPGGFLGRLNITFGGSLIIASFAQISWLARGRKRYIVPVWLYAIPVITCAVGIWMLLLPKDYQNPGSEQIFASIISGIGFIIWSVNGFMSLTQNKRDADGKPVKKKKQEATFEETGKRRIENSGKNETPEEIRMIPARNRDGEDSEEKSAEEESKTEETK